MVGLYPDNSQMSIPEMSTEAGSRWNWNWVESNELNNPQFLEKAAPAVVDKARAHAADLDEKRAKLEARRAMLGG
jgi:valyl-tRNA synthetase